MRTSNAIAVGLILACGDWSERANALGILLTDQDALATARGNAFAATADNPSALYYNPAGITQLSGHQLRAGVYGVTYRPQFRSLAGAAYTAKRGLEATPQLYYTYTVPSRRISLGLGVYSPYGLTVEWPENTGFRSVALKGQLQYLTVQPVVAWQARRTLSIAAGPTLNYARTDLIQGLSPLSGNDSFRFEGDAFSPASSLGSAGSRWSSTLSEPLTVLRRK